MSNSLFKHYRHLNPFIRAQLMARSESPHDKLVYDSQAFHQFVSIVGFLQRILPEPQHPLDPQDPFTMPSFKLPLPAQGERLQNLGTEHSMLSHDFFIRVIDRESPDFSGEFSITFTNEGPSSVTGVCDRSRVCARLHLCKPGEQDPVLGYSWDAYFILDLYIPLNPDNRKQGDACIKNLIIPRVSFAAC